MACVAAITLAPLLIVFTPGGAARASVSIYAGAIIALFAVSATYHRFTWSPAVRSIWQRVDHSMIFIAIAATYTPIAVMTLPRGSAQLVLALVWTGAALGVVSKFVFRTHNTVVIALPYVVVGWAALAVIDDFWRSLGGGGFAMVLIGGVLFTVGAVIYALKRPDPWPRWFGYHEIFHLFVIGGVALHYVVVAFVAVPQA